VPAPRVVGLGPTSGVLAITLTQGRLGQMLAFHLGLFQMAQTSTVLLAMLLLVALVDGLSYAVRTQLSR
jgi:ABC-type phosphate/phosphonate transport system permease subunit